MVPILGLASAQLNEPRSKSSDEVKAASSIQDDHHPALLTVLAEELSVKAEDVHDFELYACLLNLLIVPNQSYRHLYDTQPSVLGGINNEFIFSPRMDNLVSS